MGEPTAYENFPGRIVLLSNMLSVSIYGIGACLMAGLGVWALAAYIVYCGWMEIRLLRQGCTDCYYYGKTCAFGRGRLCALLFRQGDPQQFAQRQISWSDLLPGLRGISPARGRGYHPTGHGFSLGDSGLAGGSSRSHLLGQRRGPRLLRVPIPSPASDRLPGRETVQQILPEVRHGMRRSGAPGA